MTIAWPARSLAEKSRDALVAGYSLKGADFRIREYIPGRIVKHSHRSS